MMYKGFLETERGVNPLLLKRLAERNVPLRSSAVREIARVPNSYEGDKKSGGYRHYTSPNARVALVLAKAAMECASLPWDSGFVSARPLESYSYHRSPNGSVPRKDFHRFARACLDHLRSGGIIVRCDMENAFGSITFADIDEILQDTGIYRILPKDLLAQRFKNGLPFPCSFSDVVFELYILRKMQRVGAAMGARFVDDMSWFLSDNTPESEISMLLEELDAVGIPLNPNKFSVESFNDVTKLANRAGLPMDRHLDRYGDHATVRISYAEAYTGEGAEPLDDIDHEAMLGDLANATLISSMGANHCLKAKYRPENAQQLIEGKSVSLSTRYPATVNRIIKASSLEEFADIAMAVSRYGKRIEDRIALAMYAMIDKREERRVSASDVEPLVHDALVGLRDSRYVSPQIARNLRKISDFTNSRDLFKVEDAIECSTYEQRFELLTECREEAYRCDRIVDILSM